MKSLARPTAPALLCLAILIAGITATLAAYWPGFMTWDAIRQYGQAVSGDFDDWHPPAMEWVWRQLIAIHAGPAPMLVLQLILLWGGLAFLATWAVRERRGGLAIAIMACGLMPFSLALTGEVLKDCLMAGALMSAASVIAWRQSLPSKPLRIIMIVKAVALLVFASALRFNAFLAVVPLALALLPPAAWKTPLRMGATALIVAALSLATMPVANRLLGAKPSGVGLSLIIFDLGGITHFSGQNAFPPIADFDDSDDPAGIVSACYDPSKWDRYAWWGAAPCDIGFDNVQEAFERQHINPYSWWLKQIAAHPIAYAEHRLAHFNINARLASRDATERAVQIDSPPNEWGYKLQPSPILSMIDGAAMWSANTPFGWPIAWMALALGLLILSPALPSRRVIVPLALSALLYGLGYGVFSVASELRYHLWTMLAAAVAAVIAGADIRGGAECAKRRLLLAALPVAVTLSACFVWRLLF
ncbi:MAG: hypothetical protein V4459_01455 [Pseudomonadota bacterium]